MSNYSDYLIDRWYRNAEIKASKEYNGISLRNYLMEIGISDIDFALKEWIRILCRV